VVGRDQKVNERDIVALLTRGHSDPRALGFDDDVCVIKDGLVCSTDMLIENVDFRLTTFSPEDVARKAIAVNVSDLAAAGASFTGYTLAMAVPPHIDRAWLEAFSAGLEGPLLGGDLSRTAGPLCITVTVFGETKRLLRRRVGAVGDRICMSGELGAAAAGLLLLEQGGEGERLKLKQRRPTPRLDLGQALSANPACLGAMDLSDGLAADLPRLLPRGLGATLAPLPIADDTRAVLGPDAELLAARGGEDFELLCILRRDAPLPSGFTEIGEITADPALRLCDGRLLGPGFDHFG
jgi:thiamine-monophosphate kinase